MSIITSIDKFYEDKEIRNWDTGYFAFDIHGTILKPNYKFGDIPNEFYPNAIEALQYISKIKDIVMFLYTCSHPHEVKEYVKLFEDNDIDFKYVNENPEVKTDVAGYGNYESKPYMNVLFEDKAGFVGERDWLGVLNTMKKYNCGFQTKVKKDSLGNSLYIDDNVIIDNIMVSKIYHFDGVKVLLCEGKFIELNTINSNKIRKINY